MFSFIRDVLIFQLAVFWVSGGIIFARAQEPRPAPCDSNCQKELQKGVKKASDTLNQLRAEDPVQVRPKECPSCTTAPSPRSRVGQAGCPRVLRDLEKKNHSRGAFGLFPAPSTNCKVSFAGSEVGSPLSAFKSPKEFANYLAEDPHFALGMSRRSDLRVSQGLHLFQQGCFKSSDSDASRFEAVSDYFYLMNQLRSGMELNMEMAASLDALLDDEYLLRVLSNPRAEPWASLPRSRDWYKRVRKCPKNLGKTQLDALVENAYEKFMYREALVRFLNDGLTDPDGKRHRPTPKERKDALAQIQLVDATSSLLRGSAFQRTIMHDRLGRGPGDLYPSDPSAPDPRTRELVRSAVIAQLKENRQGLEERRKILANGLRCLNSPKGSGCNQLNKALALSPDHYSHVPTGDRKHLAAHAFMTAADCRLNAREAADSANQVARNFVVDTALTVGSAGIGWYVSTLKNAQNASWISRLFTSNNAILGINMLNRGLQFQEAAENCKMKLAQEEEALRLDTIESARNPECPKVFQQSVAPLENYGNCTLHAFIITIPALLPYVPPMLRKGVEFGSPVLQKLPAALTKPRSLPIPGALKPGK